MSEYISAHAKDSLDSFKITFHVGPDNTEVLCLSDDGFYVRGVRLERDDNEATKVYEAFKEWMAGVNIWPR